MNTTHTLKELADIGAIAAKDAMQKYGIYHTITVHSGSCSYETDRPVREAFAKAILDAIGYKLPKDEEREAFERWCQSQQPLLNDTLAKEYQFAAWKAGREELRKEVCSDKCEDSKTEPAWIPWNGGECPLPDTVKRWEYKERWNLNPVTGRGSPKSYRWKHFESGHDIIAYRVWE